MNPSDSFLVRLRRPDGSSVMVKVPIENLQRVIDLAVGEFGDPSIEKIFPPAEKSESSDMEMRIPTTAKRSQG